MMQHLLDALAEQRNVALNELALANARQAEAAAHLGKLAECVLSGQVPNECVPALCAAHPGLAALLKPDHGASPLLPNPPLGGAVGHEVSAA